MTAQTYVIRGKQTLQRWAVDRRVRELALGALCTLGGFVMSAASLGNGAQPLAMGLICGLTGFRALWAALGSMAGYWLFWGQAGYQGMVWAGLGGITALVLGKRKVVREAPALIPAIAGFWVSASGLAFQVLLGDKTRLGLYLLRIALAAGSAFLAGSVLRQRDPVTDWLAQGAGVLALAQVAPAPWLSLGFPAAGLLSVGEALPAAALAGVALDLAGVAPVSMAAVTCLAFLLRMLPWKNRWLRCAAPAGSYLTVMAMVGIWDLTPLPGLLAGGLLGTLLPGREGRVRRRGETGLAQVRLELAAGVLSQTQALLLEGADVPIDEETLLLQVKERACGSCPNRKQCRDVVLPEDSLRRIYADAGALSFPCRKPGRMLLELRRGQERLRDLKADRERRRQYREAVAQQYRFLGEYLRQLSDRLPQRLENRRQKFRPEVAVCSAGVEMANGDRCLWFAGPWNQYYILLCDGMGTGIGAAQEGQAAASMLRQMLSAGFPADAALRSLNSLCCLRGRGGAATVDLAEISLDSGWVTVYKWGAAPSWLLRQTGPEKIGTAGPPPGLSVTDAREMVDRLSLRRGEALILLSDGVDGEGALRRLSAEDALPPGELAARLLELGASEGKDDATAVVVRLCPAGLST